jgi:hypothetical protein
MLYRTTERTITVDTHIWQGEGWELTAVRTFPRGREPLEV